MSVVTLRFVHSYDPRLAADSEPKTVELSSIPLPAGFELPSRALVGVTGRTASAVDFAAPGRSKRLAFSVPVDVEVGHIPTARIGWDQVKGAAEPLGVLPLSRLRNEALEPLLRELLPADIPLQGSFQRLLHVYGTRLKRLEDVVRETSPRTKVVTLEVFQGKSRLQLGMLLSASGADIVQPCNHPFRFSFPDWLPKG